MEEALVQRRLMSRAAEVSDRKYTREYMAEITNLMREPNWRDTTKQHNWRTYVDSEVRLIWSALSESARLAIFINAETQASKEESD